MANELYDLLEVPPTSTADEIKRGYFKQVRQHPPEKEPEKFKLIRSAYETLTNTTTRSNYDALQKFGGELHKLTEEAESFMEDDNWTEATKCWKRILVLAPDSDGARSSLAMCYLLLKDTANSIKIYRQLIDKDPKVPTFWMGLGWAYSAQANDTSRSEEAEFYEKAEHAFKQVVELEPFNSAAHQAIAATKKNRGDWQGAANCYESAVGADGKLDTADFDPLYELCFAYVLLDNEGKLKNTLDRIATIVPDEQDAKEFVAGKLCCLAAAIAEKGNRFKEAAILFKQAQNLWPDNSEIKKAQKQSQTVWKAKEEHSRINSDAYVIPPLKVLVAIPLAHAHGEEVDENMFGKIMEALGSYTIQDVRDTLARLRSSYPALFKMSKDVLIRIQSVIDEQTQQSRSGQSDSKTCNKCGRSISRAIFQKTGGLCSNCYTNNSSSSSSSSTTSTSSDCFIVTAVLGSSSVHVIDHYRDFRDNFLLNHHFGRYFVRFYYVYGPVAAKWVKNRKIIKRGLAILLGSLWRILPGINLRLKPQSTIHK